MATKPYPAGWRWPRLSRKAHYYMAGETISVCGKWMYSGPLTPTQETAEGKPGPDDCTPCWRIATKQRRQPAARKGR